MRVVTRMRNAAAAGKQHFNQLTGRGRSDAAVLESPTRNVRTRKIVVVGFIGLLLATTLLVVIGNRSYAANTTLPNGCIIVGSPTSSKHTSCRNMSFNTSAIASLQTAVRNGASLRWADFSGSSFVSGGGIDLGGANMANSKWTNASLRAANDIYMDEGANLSNAVMTGATFRSTNASVTFWKSTLTGADQSGLTVEAGSLASWSDASAQNLKLVGAKVTSRSYTTFNNMNLRNADLSNLAVTSTAGGVGMRDTDARNATMSGLKFNINHYIGFTDSRFDGVNFNGSTLQGRNIVEFTGSNLTSAKMQNVAVRSTADRVDFSKSTLNKANFSNSTFTAAEDVSFSSPAYRSQINDANFNGVVIDAGRYAYFKDATLDGASFVGADITADGEVLFTDSVGAVNFKNVSMVGGTKINFSNDRIQAKWKGSDFTGAYLATLDRSSSASGIVYLSHQDLSGVSFKDVTIDANVARFSSSNLTGSDMSDMNITGAYEVQFVEANLTDANMAGSTFDSNRLLQFSHSTLTRTVMDETTFASGGGVRFFEVVGHDLSMKNSAMSSVDMTTFENEKVRGDKGSDLRRADFSGTRFHSDRGWYFSGTNLTDASFDDVTITTTRGSVLFDEATMTDASLAGITVSSAARVSWFNVDGHRMDVSNAVFHSAVDSGLEAPVLAWGIYLDGADLDGARFTNTTFSTEGEFRFNGDDVLDIVDNNPLVGVSLVGADWSGVSVTAAMIDMSYSNLSEASFDQSEFISTVAAFDMSRSDLTDTSLVEAKLQSANFLLLADSIGERANFTGATLHATGTHITASGGNLTWVRGDITDAIFDGAHLISDRGNVMLGELDADRASFNGAEMTVDSTTGHAGLYDSTLTGASFDGFTVNASYLTMRDNVAPGMNLSTAVINTGVVRFSDAHMEGAVLAGGTFPTLLWGERANLTGADLTGVDFSTTPATRIKGASFAQADLDDAVIPLGQAFYAGASAVGATFVGDASAAPYAAAFVDSDLSNSTFTGEMLSVIQFERVSLDGVTFTATPAKTITLKDGSAVGATLSATNLEQLVVSGTDLTDFKVTGATSTTVNKIFLVPGTGISTKGSNLAVSTHVEINDGAAIDYGDVTQGSIWHLAKDIWTSTTAHVTCTPDSGFSMGVNTDVAVCSTVWMMPSNRTGSTVSEYTPNGSGSYNYQLAGLGSAYTHKIGDDLRNIAESDVLGGRQVLTNKTTTAFVSASFDSQLSVTVYAAPRWELADSEEILSGKTVRLTYQVTGYPAPEVTENSSTLPGTIDLIEAVSSDTSTLVTVEVTPTEPGVFVLGLTATNDRGSSHMSVSITVLAPEYSIIFDGNPDIGTIAGEMEPMTVVYGCEDCTLTPNGFVKSTGAAAFIDDSLDERVELTSTFLGWSRDAAARTADIPDEAYAGDLSMIDGDTITLYAVWDDAPQFTLTDFPHRFFSLDQAQAGDVTEVELLSSVRATDRETSPLETKTREQVVASGSDVGITLYDYEASDFTSLTASGNVSVTYKVKDEADHVAFLRIRVGVTGEGAQHASRSYLRGIDSTYVDKPASEGGLAQDSVWRTDPTRQTALSDALTSDEIYAKFCLDSDIINDQRAAMGEHGLGNSGSDAALSVFNNALRTYQEACSP